jgi:NADH-quinone oxidoreductase subunit E
MNGSISTDKVYQIIEDHDKSKEKLIQILLRLQEASGRNYLPREWMDVVAAELNIPLTKVYDVVTFYDMFKTEPRGKFIIEICKSGPCHVNKPKGIIGMFEKNLGIKMGETTSDNLFTLAYASCFGACDLSPAVKIGEDVYGNLTEEKIADLIKQYRGV